MESTDVGWSAVPNWLIRDSDLGTYELLVFIALLNRADKRGEAWPSLPTLQRDARASKDSVLRALRALEERGLVEVVKRRNEDGSNASNLYRVHPHGGSRSQRPPSRSQRPGGSLTATGVVAHSDGGSRSQRPEVLPIEVLPIEEDPEKDSSSEVAAATPRPDVERLLDLLDSLIVENGSKAPKRNKANTDAMRLLVDRDGRTPEQVEKAIRWCQADAFWRANILSASKLRAKYDQIRLAAIREQEQQRPVRQPAMNRALDEFQRLYGGDDDAGTGRVRALGVGSGS